MSIKEAYKQGFLARLQGYARYCKLERAQALAWLLGWDDAESEKRYWGWAE